MSSISSERVPNPVNSVVEAGLRFCFCSKTHTQAPICEFVRHHGAKTVIGFSQFFATLSQKVMMHRSHCDGRLQRAKPLHLAELDVLVSVLALLNASIVVHCDLVPMPYNHDLSPVMTFLSISGSWVYIS